MTCTKHGHRYLIPVYTTGDGKPVVEGYVCTECTDPCTGGYMVFRIKA